MCLVHPVFPVWHSFPGQDASSHLVRAPLSSAVLVRPFRMEMHVQSCWLPKTDDSFLIQANKKQAQVSMQSGYAQVQSLCASPANHLG